MSTTSTDPRDIEADLERERASLASTLDELSDRVSVDSLARDALDSLKSHASSYTSTIDGAVRANPLALGLIGAGVAWFLLGGRIGGSSSSHDTPPTGHPTRDELPRWEGEGGQPPDYGSIAYRPTSSSADDDWSREAHGLRGRAMAAIHRIEADAKSYYDSVRQGITGGAATARDFAGERAKVVSDFTADLRARLSHGLDALPEGSRERVIAARERAYAAALRAEREGRQIIRDPARALEEHPLVAGAVAFAVGAAVAAALPRTETEDRAFGAERDRLMDEASRLFQSEKDRALRVAGSLTDDLKATARDAASQLAEQAKTAAQSLGDTVSDKAANLADRAVEAADQASAAAADRLASEVERDEGRPAPVVG
jgi:hypothetical protein